MSLCRPALPALPAWLVLVKVSKHHNISIPKRIDVLLGDNVVVSDIKKPLEKRSDFTFRFNSPLVLGLQDLYILVSVQSFSEQTMYITYDRRSVRHFITEDTCANYTILSSWIKLNGDGRQ